MGISVLRPPMKPGLYVALVAAVTLLLPSAAGDPLPDGHLERRDPGELVEPPIPNGLLPWEQLIPIGPYDGGDDWLVCYGYGYHGYGPIDMCVYWRWPLP